MIPHIGAVIRIVCDNIYKKSGDLLIAPEPKYRVFPQWWKGALRHIFVAAIGAE